MDAEESQLLRTALNLLESYDKWDIDAIIAPRAENCVQQVYPSRLNRPKQNNAEYREYFEKGVMPHFKDFHVSVTDIIEDPKRNKVAVHAQSTAETALGPYANEYVIIMHMTEDHKEVVHIKEFVDSEYSQSFFPKLREHIAQRNTQ